MMSTKRANPMIDCDIEKFFSDTRLQKSDSSTFISVLLKYIVISGGFW